MRAKLIDHLFSQPNNELHFCPTRRKKGHKNICVLNEIMRGITLHTIPEAMGKAQWWAFAHGTHDSLLNSQVASNRPYFKDEGWSKMHFLFYWLDGCILNLLARSSSRECRKIICLELVYFFAFFFSDTCLPIVACQSLDRPRSDAYGTQAWWLSAQRPPRGMEPSLQESVQKNWMEAWWMFIQSICV